jgi:hypothetical protein
MASFKRGGFWSYKFYFAGKRSESPRGRLRKLLQRRLSSSTEGNSRPASITSKRFASNASAVSTRLSTNI